MLYDDGNYSQQRPTSRMYMPYMPQPTMPQPRQQQVSPFFAQSMGQGSYADYYNGLTGRRSSRRKNPYGDIMRIPGAKRYAQPSVPAYGAPMQMPLSMPRVQYRSGVPAGQRPGMGLSYMQQQPELQRDYAGRMPGRWDYQQPMQQVQYPMVTY